MSRKFYGFPKGDFCMDVAAAEAIRSELSNDQILAMWGKEKRYLKENEVLQKLKGMGGERNDGGKRHGKYTTHQYARMLRFTEMRLEPPGVTSPLGVYVSNPSAAPGHYYVKLGYKSKAAALSDARIRASMVIWRLQQGEPPEEVEPVVWMCATREKEFDVLEEKKTGVKKLARLLVVPDMIEGLIGGCITQPIQACMKTIKLPIVYGEKWEQDGFALLALRMCRYNSRYIMLDATDFSKNLPRWIIKQAFGVIYHAFDPSSDRGLLERILDWAYLQLVYSYIVLPNGVVVRTCGGNKSGSVWTTLIDSICNFMMLKDGIKHVCDDYYLSVSVFVKGDDSVIEIPNWVRGVQMKDLCSYLSSEFGYIPKVSQSYGTDYFYTTPTTRGVEFLGHYWGESGLPVRDTMKTVMQLTHPSRGYRTTGDKVMNTLCAYLNNPFNTQAARICYTYGQTLYTKPAWEGSMHKVKDTYMIDLYKRMNNIWAFNYYTTKLGNDFEIYGKKKRVVWKGIVHTLDPCMLNKILPK